MASGPHEPIDLCLLQWAFAPSPCRFVNRKLSCSGKQRKGFPAAFEKRKAVRNHQKRPKYAAVDIDSVDVESDTLVQGRRPKRNAWGHPTIQEAHTIFHLLKPPEKKSSSDRFLLKQTKEKQHIFLNKWKPWHLHQLRDRRRSNGSIKGRAMLCSHLFAVSSP